MITSTAQKIGVVSFFFLNIVNTAFAAGEKSTPTVVFTPRKSPVSVSIRSPEMTPAEIYNTNVKAVALFAKQGASLIGDSTIRYNCHSYAWHMQSTSNNIWMGTNTTGVESIYWRDGSYGGVSVATPPNTYRISYNFPYSDHSAFSVGSGYVISKWGQGPLMRHPISVGPYKNMKRYVAYRKN